MHVGGASEAVIESRLGKINVLFFHTLGMEIVGKKEGKAIRYHERFSISLPNPTHASGHTVSTVGLEDRGV